VTIPLPQIFLSIIPAWGIEEGLNKTGIDTSKLFRISRLSSISLKNK